MYSPGLRQVPFTATPALESHIEVLELVHMKAAATHAGLCGPTGGAISPG
jgi:hypothetical protein